MPFCWCCHEAAQMLYILKLRLCFYLFILFFTGKHLEYWRRTRAAPMVLPLLLTKFQEHQEPCSSGPKSGPSRLQQRIPIALPHRIFSFSNSYIWNNFWPMSTEPIHTELQNISGYSCCLVKISSLHHFRYIVLEDNKIPGKSPKIR